MYRIREVDGLREDVAEAIADMHEVCFRNTAAPVDTSEGWWWLVYHGKYAVAFAGLTFGKSDKDTGYLVRSGVMPKYRGRGLQKRLIRAREMKARKIGLHYIVTDTTFNTASSNSLIKAGYKLFTPKRPWAFKSTLYWRKEMK